MSDIQPQSPGPGEDDRHFRTDHLQTGLQRRSVRGGAVTFAFQGAKFVINMGAIAVLGRLLRVEDYGLVGMAAVLTGLLSTLSNLGLSAATIQSPRINHDQVSTLFWVNVAVSALIGGVIAGAAPVLVWFYGEPRLMGITLALSGTFLVTGLGVQHKALIVRQMRYTSSGAVELIALAGGLAVGIGTAWIGAGYWALVAQQYALAFTGTVAAWIACGWRPSRPKRPRNVRSMVTFGGYLSGCNLVGYAAKNCDGLIIGRYIGAEPVGFYTRANALLIYPLSQILTPLGSVAVPALSRVSEDPVRYRSAFLRIHGIVAMVTMPLVAFLTSTSDWFVRLVLGPQWTEAGRIFAVLGIMAFTMPLTSTTSWVFVTQQRGKEYFQWSLANAVVALGAIILGLKWGVMGIAACYAISGLAIRAPLMFWFAARNSPVKLLDFYRVPAPHAALALAILAAVHAMRWWFHIVNPLQGLAAAGAVAVVVYLAMVMSFRSGRQAVVELGAFLQHLKPDAGPAAAPALAADAETAE